MDVSYVRLRRSRNLIDGNLVGCRFELMLRSKSAPRSLLPSYLNENFETVLLVGDATDRVYSDLVRLGEPNGLMRLMSSFGMVGSTSVP